MNPRPRAPGPGPSPARAPERGFALLMVYLVGATLAVLLYLALPDWINQRRRDREAEMISRGEQIASAIREFQQENSRWPTSLEELTRVGPKQHRYLRKEYTDPLNPAGDWDLIPLGDPAAQAEVQAVGQPGAGIPGAPAAPITGLDVSDFEDKLSDPFEDAFGTASDAGDGDSGADADGRRPVRAFRSGRCRGSGAPAGVPGASGIPPAPGQPAPIGQPIGQVIGQPIGQPLGEAGPGTQIIGVTSLIDEEGLREYRDKKRYCEWLFLATRPIAPAGQPGQGPIINPPTPLNPGGRSS